MKQAEIKESLLKLEVRWPAGFEVCKTCKHPACKISEFMKLPKDERPESDYQCCLKGNCHSCGKEPLKSRDFLSGKHFLSCNGEKALISNGYEKPVREAAKVAEDSSSCPEGSFASLWEAARQDAQSNKRHGPPECGNFTYGEQRERTETSSKKQKQKLARFRKQQTRRKAKADKFSNNKCTLYTTCTGNYMYLTYTSKTVQCKYTYVIYTIMRNKLARVVREFFRHLHRKRMKLQRNSMEGLIHGTYRLMNYPLKLRRMTPKPTYHLTVLRRLSERKLQKKLLLLLKPLLLQRNRSLLHTCIIPYIQYKNHIQ